MQSGEDYIGDLPGHVHSTAFEHKQNTKTLSLLLVHPVPTDTIFVNHIDGSNTSMVDNELLVWMHEYMHEYKQCSTMIIGLQVNRCKSTAA